MSLQLIPLCTIDSTLTEPTVVGKGAGLVEESYFVLHASVHGAHLSGTMRGKSEYDWMTVPGGVGSVRTRAIIETDDGASISLHYEARADITNGTASVSAYCAPLFSTMSPDYLWLNLVQAVGRGTLDGDRIHWDWYQVTEAD